MCSPTSSAMSGLSSRDISKIVLRPGTRRSLYTPVVVTNAVFLMLKFIMTAGDSCDKFVCSILEEQFAVARYPSRTGSRRWGKWFCVSCGQDKGRKENLPWVCNSCFEQSFRPARCSMQCLQSDQLGLGTAGVSTPARREEMLWQGMYCAISCCSNSFSFDMAFVEHRCHSQPNDSLRGISSRPSETEARLMSFRSKSRRSQKSM